ncbi:MAG: adenylate kinase [Desulfurococcales archaeon ex4484_42]|nr:MAG: adenylate kinase [Desulfurococcales archaeon ex4484_42]
MVSKFNSSLKLIVMVGLPGVGKSTVINLVVKKLKEKGYNVEVINFGDFMLKFMVSKGYVKSRDEIRKLPLTIQQEAQTKSAKEIRRRFEELSSKSEGIFIGIVDTHALIKTETGLWPGLPKHVIEELRPHAIIVIEASPKEIVSRQLRDKTRYRADYAREELITELLNLNRVFAISSAVLVGASVATVMNKEGKAEEAAEEVVNIIERI